jgi:hypothetical protein
MEVQLNFLIPILMEWEVFYTSQAANLQYRFYWCLRRRK